MYGADLEGETRGVYFSLAFSFFFFFYKRINNIAPRFFSEKAASYEQELCEMSAGKKGDRISRRKRKMSTPAC